MVLYCMLLHLKMLQGVLDLELELAFGIVLCPIPYGIGLYHIQMDWIFHYSLQLSYAHSISHTLWNELGPYPMNIPTYPMKQYHTLWKNSVLTLWISLHTLWNNPIPYENPYIQSRSPFVTYLHQSIYRVILTSFLLDCSYLTFHLAIIINYLNQASVASFLLEY